MVDWILLHLNFHPSIRIYHICREIVTSFYVYFYFQYLVWFVSRVRLWYYFALHWHRSISRFLSIFCHFTSMWSMYKYLCAEKSRIKILFRISASITHTASFDIFNDDDDDVENYSSIPKYMYIIWVKISDAIPVANRRKGKRNEMKRKLIDLVYIRSVSRV